MIEITPVYEDFVAELTNLDVTQLTSEQFKTVANALDQYAVLVLPNQPVNEAQQLDFASRFGPLETSVGASIYNADSKRRLAQRELSDISNLDDSDGILGQDDVRRMINVSNRLWHTDSSFKRTPSSISMLAAQEVVPAGGATEFADMRAAWDALMPEKQQEIQDLIAEHDYFHSRKLTGFDAMEVRPEWIERQPPVSQVLVRTHPESGRKSLYLASHISQIYGMSQDEGLALVKALMAHATQPQFVYRHRWRPDDIVIWDNRYTMHRGTPFNEKYRRAMRRATVEDIGPTVENNPTV